MTETNVEVGLFNGLNLTAKRPNKTSSPVEAFIYNTSNLKGTGLTVWLVPHNKPGFDEEALTLACANNLPELASEIRQVIGPSVRHAILSEFWPEAPEELHWHLAIRAPESGPVIELVAATTQTMQILIACYHCELGSVFY